MHKIQIYPANIQYQASSETTLLNAALANKCTLEHSCRKGSCGVCVAEILSGLVKDEHGDMVNSGSILTCQSFAHSDTTLKANYFTELTDIECVTAPCKISKLTFMTDDIIALTLRLPPTTKFDYLPGQYIDLISANKRRSYSIANAPTDSKTIELHIRLLEDGDFSRLLKNATLNQLMHIEGPKGTFFVREAPNPIIFLAGGTGFAPIKAMVEGLLASKSQRDIYIYWGMPQSKSFYSDIAKSWEIESHRLHYVPVLSSEDSTWTGRKGFVHQAVLDDFKDLSPFHVYACGQPLMIKAARDTFVAKGLDKMHFYSDVFVASR